MTDEDGITMTPAERERVRARLRVGMESEEAGVTGEPGWFRDRPAGEIGTTPRRHPVAPPSRRGVHWVLAGAAAVVVIAAAVAVVGQDRGADEMVTGATTPVEDLGEVADRARSRAEPLLDDDEHRYSYLHTAHTEARAASPTWTEEHWIAQDGTGRRITTFDSPPPGRDAAVDETFTDPEDPVPAMSSWTFPGLAVLLEQGDPSLGDLARIIDDDRTPTEAMSTALVNVLAWPGVPATARGNLFDLLDAVGFESIGPTPDPRGRLGAGYRGPGPNGATVIFVIDPVTTRPLGFSSGGLRQGDLEPPTLDEGPLSQTTTYLDAALTPDTDPP